MKYRQSYGFALTVFLLSVVCKKCVFVMGVRRLVVLLRCVKCRHYSQTKRHIFTVWLAVIKKQKRGCFIFMLLTLCCPVLSVPLLRRGGKSLQTHFGSVNLYVPTPGGTISGFLFIVWHCATPKILRKQKYLILANFWVLNTKMALKLRTDSGFQITYGVS